MILRYFDFSTVRYVAARTLAGFSRYKHRLVFTPSCGSRDCSRALKMQVRRFGLLLGYLLLYVLVVFVVFFEYLASPPRQTSGKRNAGSAFSFWSDRFPGPPAVTRQLDFTGRPAAATLDATTFAGRCCRNESDAVDGVISPDVREVCRLPSWSSKGDNLTTLDNATTRFQRSDDAGDFQWVNTDGGLSVYAAHYDDVHTPPVVVVVAIRAKTYSADNIICCFANFSDQPPDAVLQTQGKLTDLPGAGDKLYRAAYVICTFPNVTSRPQQLSLIPDSNALPNTLEVVYPIPGPPRHQVALCVPPVHSRYDIWRQAVETFELLQLLGVTLANAYEEKAGANLSRVFGHYVARGFLTVRSWRSPPSPIHTFGHLAAIHDCLLRMRHVARYVAFADLDEVIVPRVHDTWPEMLQHVLAHAQAPERVGAFLFLNAFYHVGGNKSSSWRRLSLRSSDLRLPLSDQQLDNAVRLQLVTATRLYRGRTWREGRRSKAIVDPLKAVSLFIHYPVQLAEGFVTLTVPPHVALLHHYRRGWDWRWDRGSDERELDEVTLRFVPTLTERVQRVLQDLSAF